MKMRVLAPLIVASYFPTSHRIRYRKICTQSVHLRYKIIDSRNQNNSTALATNADVKKWGDYLSDGLLAIGFPRSHRR
jgi:hypothetical protein